MTKKEIIEYLYENNVRGDLTIEQMADDLADRKTEPQRTCDNCGTPRDKCVYCIEEDRMWTPQTERSSK